MQIVETPVSTTGIVAVSVHSKKDRSWKGRERCTYSQSLASRLEQDPQLLEEDSTDPSFMDTEIEGRLVNNRLFCSLTIIFTSVVDFLQILCSDALNGSVSFVELFESDAGSSEYSILGSLETKFEPLHLVVDQLQQNPAFVVF
jgi:hypothetical protein